MDFDATACGRGAPTCGFTTTACFGARWTGVLAGADVDAARPDRATVAAAALRATVGDVAPEGAAASALADGSDAKPGTAAATTRGA